MSAWAWISVKDLRRHLRRPASDFNASPHGGGRPFVHILIGLGGEEFIRLRDSKANLLRGLSGVAPTNVVHARLDEDGDVIIHASGVRREGGT